MERALNKKRQKEWLHGKNKTNRYNINKLWRMEKAMPMLRKKN
jgi:hypothetical protein